MKKEQLFYVVLWNYVFILATITVILSLTTWVTISRKDLSVALLLTAIALQCFCFAVIFYTVSDYVKKLKFVKDHQLLLQDSIFREKNDLHINLKFFSHDIPILIEYHINVTLSGGEYKLKSITTENIYLAFGLGYNEDEHQPLINEIIDRKITSIMTTGGV